MVVSIFWRLVRCRLDYQRCLCEDVHAYLGWVALVWHPHVSGRVLLGRVKEVKDLTTERDYRALITVILLILTGVVCLYGMYLGWSTPDVLAVTAFFGQWVMAAITYYFVSKQVERVTTSRKQQ